jgi:hypothetical protein
LIKKYPELKTVTFEQPKIEKKTKNKKTAKESTKSKSKKKLDTNQQNLFN